MAEAAVTFLLENVSSVIQKEAGSFMGFDGELKKLSSTLTTIRAVLADAEMKQFEDMAIKNWLQKVEDAAFLLDDILDECSTHDLLREYQKHKLGWINKVNSFSCNSSFGLKNAMFRRRMVNEMKRVRETLESVAEERKKFHLSETLTTSEKRGELIDWRQTSSVLTQPEVYGREKDKERIMQALIGSSGDADVSVYPIVGLGGLGKTTLAQLIFNHDRITQHFELKMWVCVSEDFSLKRIIKAILESASGSANQDLELDPLQKQLQQTLQGKRCFLVLDDVWSEDQEKWERLKYSISACRSKGVSILVTTRLTKVAFIMGTLPPHDLSFLSEEDCWSLFKQRAFGHDEEGSKELVTIGKQITKKCKGLPLAAKALGSLLRFKRDEEDWLYVKDSEIWNLPQDENSILPVLRLSYLNLPLKSRRCFSFCAIFSKDWRIEKDDLIHLWMANGFISSRGKKMVEDIAEEIINELCWASFFQDIEVDDLGNVVRFKIHDLIHDLAQFVMGDACHIVNDEKSTELQKRPRHVMIVDPFTWKHLVTSCQIKTSRTLYSESSMFINFPSPEMFRPFESLGKLPCLKKLEIRNMPDVQYVDDESYDGGVAKGFPSLEYLSLSYMPKLERLSKDEGGEDMFQCLSKLRIIACPNLAFTSLPSVSELTISKRGSELYYDTISEQLLQQHLIPVGSCNQVQLSSIRNLSCLEILYLSNYRDLASFPRGMLQNLACLRKLHIYDYSKLEVLPTELVNFVALEELHIEGCHSLESLTRQALNGLGSLQRLTIDECDKFKGLSASFQCLTSLKHLTISRCPKVVALSEDLQHIPLLQSISLSGLPNLECIPDCWGRVRSLQSLHIKSCRKLKSLPLSGDWLDNLKQLTIEECPDLQKQSDG